MIWSIVGTTPYYYNPAIVGLMPVIPMTSVLARQPSSRPNGRPAANVEVVLQLPHQIFELGICSTIEKWMAYFGFLAKSLRTGGLILQVPSWKR